MHKTIENNAPTDSCKDQSMYLLHVFLRPLSIKQHIIYFL